MNIFSIVDLPMNVTVLRTWFCNVLVRWSCAWTWTFCMSFFFTISKRFLTVAQTVKWNDRSSQDTFTIRSRFKIKIKHLNFFIVYIFTCSNRVLFGDSAGARATHSNDCIWCCLYACICCYFYIFFFWYFSNSNQFVDIQLRERESTSNKKQKW